MKAKITLRRIAAVIMCTCFLSCAVGSLLNASITDVRAGNSTEALASQEIKARLLWQIMEEGWDPYSADMTLEEYYALMELYDDGMLPTNTANTAAISAYSALGMAVPYAEETASGILIPHTMFLLSGLPADCGLDDYDNVKGSVGDTYPPGLDRYGVGYKLPPASWAGVGVKTDPDTGAMRAAVIDKGTNDDKPNVAGDVDQELFPEIDGYYVKSLSAEGADVSILGVIDKGNGDYVYYYMSMADQSTLVSSTTLPAGAKFIINYSPNEHAITYKIEMEDGSKVPDDITLDSMFGAARPRKTVEAAYSFDVIAPYGYTARMYREINGVRVEYTGPNPPEGQALINDGYPLGTEPEYGDGATENNGAVSPNTAAGPSAMTVNTTFYNNSVTEDRTVVAVLTKKPAPEFFFAPRYHNSNNVASNRGTSALREIKAKDNDGNEVTVPYDYEDVYLWANDGDSKYEYYEDKRSLGGASKGNIKDGNIATGDNWNWPTKPTAEPMVHDEETDTYSYQWTFQTNSGDNYIMDTLTINGVPISIPYFPKDTKFTIGDFSAKGKESGLTCWHKDTTLPDGANVRVEMLMIFHPSGNPQRVYRITVTGARSNVTITGMNLIQYASGDKEVAVYTLEGVHADAGDDTSQELAIEYYSKAFGDIPADQWRTGELAQVLVGQPNYDGGDANNHGANIRFKLADGYGEPYYLLEKFSGGIGVIDNQASATRLEDESVANKNPVISLDDVGDSNLDSQHIYGPDAEGWYYIRLTGQSSYKMAMLTIGAVPVRYVVHYVSSGYFPADKDKGLEERLPENMPTFDHTDSDPSFQTADRASYDDNGGRYYDTVKNHLITIDTTVPNDPKNWYKFVDWVIVNEKDEWVQVPPESQTVSLYAGEPEEEGGEEEVPDYAIHIKPNRALDVNDVNEYSVENDGLGGNAVSVRVIRLMPTWKPVINPFKYSVVVDWVDSLGELHQEHFKDYWDDILTDSTDDALTVFVNKEAEPLQRWLREHPTYLFWDEVNNAVDDTDGTAQQKIEASMNALYPELRARNDWDQPGSLYNKVLTELLKRDISGGLNGDKPDNIDDFSRLGGYAFSVHQKGGKIVIWMCEKKSGLDIRNDVQVDALSEGEEFYYTVNATSGNLPLEGVYKAYPEGFEVELEDGTKERRIKDKDGKERKMLDSDAWLVKFEKGKISNIIENVKGAEFPENPENPVTYFTFEGSPDERVNKGIILYAPLGDYTVTEVGSKSGGSYKVNLSYINDAEAHVEGTVEWRKASGDQWLRCSAKRPITEINDPDYDKILDGTYSQVSAGIKFKIGSCNKLYIMQFNNQTSALTIGNEVEGDSSSDIAFSYKVKLKLPDKIKPLKKDGTDDYYFNYTSYLLETDTKDGNNGIITLSPIENDPDGFNWEGTVDVANHRQLRIITSVPEQPVIEEQPDPEEPKIIKAFALLGDDPENGDSEETDSEQTVPANYSVHEMPIPEKYELKEITTKGSSIMTSSVDDSNAAGMLGAVEGHEITFRHVRTLPQTGGRGVGLICISGVLLTAAGLYLLRRKAE